MQRDFKLDDTIEISELIDEINSKCNKHIKKASKNCLKLIDSTKKELERANKGVISLIEETDPQLTEEGIAQIKKKGKIYFRSLKAINQFSHLTKDKLNEITIPKTKKTLTYGNFKAFNRNLSKKLSDIDKERVVTDKIMGIDFMIKKRKLYDPLSKMNTNLKKQRDLMNEDYQVIKTVEDLSSIKIELESLFNKSEELLEEKDTLSENLQKIESDYETVDNEYNNKEHIEILQELHDSSIRRTELEIEIGKHLNSFRKIFKKYARQSQKGTISAEFAISSAALKYSENPVNVFLTSENNFEILNLLKAIIPIGIKDLSLNKGNINSLENKKKQIDQGKLDTIRDEWNTINTRITDIEKSTGYIEIKTELNEINTRRESIKGKMDELTDKIDLITKEIDETLSSIKERRERAKELYTNTLELVK